LGDGKALSQLRLIFRRLYAKDWRDQKFQYQLCSSYAKDVEEHSSLAGDVVFSLSNILWLFLNQMVRQNVPCTTSLDFYVESIYRGLYRLLSDRGEKEGKRGKVTFVF